MIAGRVRLRVTCRKSAYLIFTVTVRPKACLFSHQAQTSSAIASTPASMATGSVRSSAKVISDPEDLRGRSATTLGEKLVVRDAGRRSQAGLGEDAGANFRCGRGRRGDVSEIFGHVEIGLVERE